MAKIIVNRLIAGSNGLGRGVVVKQPIPPLKRGQVLMRVRAATISPGSELRMVLAARKGPSQGADVFRPLGYQNSGEVIRVGAGVRDLKPGDRIAAFGGGYAYISDYAVVPQRLCCRLPDSVSFIDGAYGNVMLTGLYAIRRAQAQLGGNLLVVGMGIVGQFTAQFGRLAGMSVMTWDTIALRNRVARKCGAHAGATIGVDDPIAASKAFTAGVGFDVAVMAIGGDGSEALKQVKQVMQLSPDGHEMGRVVLVGGMTANIQGGAGLGNLDLCASSRTGPGYHDDAWEHGRRDYPEVFVRWTTQSNFALGLNLIARGDVNVKPLTTHKLPIQRIDDAITAYAERPDRTLGVAVVMD